MTLICSRVARVRDCYAGLCSAGVLGLLGGLPQSGLAATPTAFYVAPSGDDGNDGSEMHPFATLAKAQGAMQASATIKTTLIETGLYVITNPLALTGADDGETWSAAPGAAATISGGQVLSGWITKGPSLYTASAPLPVGIDLRIDGVRQFPADFARNAFLPFVTGWRVVDSTRPAPNPNPYGFSDGFNALPADATAVAPGSIVQTADQFRYGSTFAMVTAVDTATGVITTNYPYFNHFSAGSWRLLATASDLSGFGQFAYTSGSPGTVTLQSSVSPIGHVVMAAVQKTLISLTGVSNVTISGLTLADTTTSLGSDGVSAGGYPAACSVGAITGTGVSEALIEGNRFENVGNGVNLCFASNTVISGNRFLALNGQGVQLHPVTVSSSSGSMVEAGNNNSIIGNTMSELGAMGIGSGGVWLEGEINVIVDGNRIDGTGRAGIAVYGGKNGSVGVTLSNNTLLNSSQQSSDTGAIYVSDNPDGKLIDTGMLIVGNRIENLGGLGRSVSPQGVYGPANPGTQGIYLDEGTSYVEVSKNVIESPSTGIYLANAQNGTSNVAENNVIVIQPAADFVQVGQKPTAASTTMNYAGVTRVELLPSYFPTGLTTSTFAVQLSGTSTENIKPAFELRLDGRVIGRGVATLAGHATTIKVFRALATPHMAHQIKLTLVNGAVNGTPTQVIDGLTLYVNNAVVPIAGVQTQGLLENATTTHFSIDRNIISRAAGQAPDNYWAVPSGTKDPNPGEFDYNLLAGGITPTQPGALGPAVNEHSVRAPAGFVNAKIGDYRLSPLSIAPRLGFSTTGMQLAPPSPVN